MAGAATTTSSLATLMQTYYDKLLLERLTPKLHYDQFAVKKPLPGRNGKIVLWNRYTNLGEGYTLTELDVPGLSAMSASKVSATLIQKGYLIGISDLFEMTSISDPVKDAVSLLSDGAAKTIDSVYKENIGFGSAASTGVADAASATYPSCYTEGFPVLENSVVRWSVFGLSNNLVSTWIDTDRLRDATTHLRNMDCPPFDDGYYVGIAHPNILNRLMQCSAWTNWNQYTNPQAMYKGEVGKVMGIRFLSSTNAITKAVLASAWSAGASNFSAGGTLYGTLVFGKYAYGGTKMYAGNGARIEIVSNKPDKADPLGMYGTAGYKITMACKILNPSCGVIVADYISA